MGLAVAFFILLAASLAHPAFLVGEGRVGEKIPVLCERQEYFYVSAPAGAAVRKPLDSDFQSSFTPEVAGPHTVQCGNETKVVGVAPAAVAGKAREEQGIVPSDSLVLAGVAALLLFFAAFSALLAKQMIFGRTIFVKHVEGGRARLHVRAGKKMGRVEISDPVSMGYPGEALRFSIPLLLPGAEWSYEYEIDAQERALPAGLEADFGGKKISILSVLYIERKKSETGIMAGKKMPKLKRKLPKAAK